VTASLPSRPFITPLQAIKTTMSTTREDFIEKEKFSNCCGAAMYELGDCYLCCDCKEYCEPVDEE